MAQTSQPELPSTAKLSLVEWSKVHIKRVFEASTEMEALKAVEETFSKELKATVNGTAVGYPHIKGQVVSQLKSSAEDGVNGRLKVTWKAIIDSESNPSARVERPSAVERASN